MLRMLAFTLALIAVGRPAAADPFYGFFDYQKPRLPVGGDCKAISASIGRGATWYGEFSGKRHDNFEDKYYPFAARGCFESELDCRLWQHQALTYIEGGPLYYMTCRLGGAW